MVVNLFQEIVKRESERPALKTRERVVSYGELESITNGIAVALKAHSLTSNETVALLFDHSPEAVIATLSALKSETIYVPMDATYPEKRLSYMLKHANTGLIITEKAYLPLAQRLLAIANISRPILLVEDIEPITTLTMERKIEATEPAYLLYTSGSTGQPKGVMKSRENLRHSVVNFSERLGLTKVDRLTLFSSFGHEAGVKDIFAALLNGATLYLIDLKNETNVKGLHQWLKDEKITIWHSIPTVYRYFLRSLQITDNFPDLRMIVLGGEPLLEHDLIGFKQYFPGATLANLYGMTESSLNAIHLIDRNTSANQIILGKPVKEVDIRVVNELGEALQSGVGEVLIVSEQVSAGYWRAPELTEQAFFTDPLFGRCYHTGDLGEVLVDGSIRLCGRKDQQVKIRGYRIELGEIESKLLDHPAVDEVAVTSRTDDSGQKVLCAYIVIQDEAALKKMRPFLAEVLPQYMIPTYFVPMEKLPLTATGKVDRRALPEPNLMGNQEYVAPANDIETRLQHLWERVLEVSTPGVEDNFFVLGGHSLKAMSLAAQIYQEFQIELPVGVIFEQPTIRRLAVTIGQERKGQYASISQIPTAPYYAVSSAQRRQYALNQLEGDSMGYNIPIVRVLNGKLDRQRLEGVFHKLIQRHESLRTSFAFINEEPVQVVHPEVEFSVEYAKITEEELNQNLHDFIRPFDLNQAPLLRAGLFKLNEEKHILMLDMHHIVSDGTSMGILIYEMVTLYEGMSLPEERIQYRDFAAWQNQELETNIMQKQEAYWLAAFAGEIPVLNLPTDESRPAMQSFAGNALNFALDAEMTSRLKSLALQQGATLYMTLLAAYNVLLARYSGQNDIIVGTPVAGRTHVDIARTVGMFINTLAMRNYPHETKRFDEFLCEVKINSLRAFENQDYQFEELVEKVGVRRDLSRNPLFDTLFALQNIDVPEIQTTCFQIKRYEYANQIAKFDLSIYAYEHVDGLQFKLEYCTRLFKKETMERLIGHYCRILDQIVSNPSIQLREIDLLQEHEKDNLLHCFNSKVELIGNSQTIQQRFEKQVTRTPNAVAVIVGDEVFSYAELNQQANRLARTLQKKGVGSEKIVGLMVERSAVMLTGILAILKAGGAYLPLDPEYPVDRVKYMLQDSNCKLLMTQAKFQPNLLFDGEVLDLTETQLYIKDVDAESNLELECTPSDMAYMIYTSGSTGRPKGVMIEHQAIDNFAHGITAAIPFVVGERILNVTTISFDIFVLETLVPLMNGLTIVIADEKEQRDGMLLATLLQRHQVTMMQTTPSRMQLLLAETEAQKVLQQLQVIMLGGESLPQPLLEKVSSCTDARIFNLYGPTETTVWSAVKELTRERKVTIGKPLLNTKIHIIDSLNRLQPVNIAGELCIAGAGLARGYWNRAKLTKEKFSNNPFQPNQKMYRTGDLARWLPNGEIEFLGRLDQQVKIRGYRIELGEIENLLLSHPAIKEAAIVDRTDKEGTSYLCAYFASDTKLTVKQLREFLSQSLPEYMIPSYFSQMNKLPRTPNSKIDRKALPKVLEGVQSGRKYVAPRTPLERRLQEIWSEVLKTLEPSIDDNFFELGGHSLNAITFVAKVSKEFGVRLQLSEIFLTPTIRELAESINSAEGNYDQKIRPIEKQKYYILSSAQRRIYALSQFDEESVNYNITLVKIVDGQLEPTRVEATCQELLKRHENLRTSFVVVNGELVQQIKDQVNFAVEYRKSLGMEIQHIVQQFVRPFDLAKGPLFRASVVKLSEQQNLLLFDLHHIIADRASLGVLIRDFSAFYSGNTLPALPLQYKDFAAWQNEFFLSPCFQQEETYWLNHLAIDLPVLNLPIDFPRPATQSFEGEIYDCALTPELTRHLRKLATSANATTYMTLLAIFYLLLSRYSGQEDIIIGSAMAGRLDADLEQVIGMFINMLALRISSGGEKLFSDFLQEVRTICLKGYENQNYQFEQLVERLNIARDLSRNPLFDVVFSAQNIEIPELEISGLTSRSYEYRDQIAKFDLTVMVFEEADKIHFRIEYCTRLFKAETIEQFARHYLNLISEVVRQPNQRLQDVQMLTLEEKAQILSTAKGPEVVVPRTTIDQLFAKQVALTPEAVAIQDSDQSMTYAKLNDRANQMAHLLQKKGVGLEDRVGIMLERSTDAVIGMLGTLKAGSAYLPISPTNPQRRVLNMLKETGSKVLLTKSEHIKEYPYTSLQNLRGGTAPVLTTCPRGQIIQLDNLPIPDRTLVDYSRYSQFIGNAMVKNAISLQDSRGCPYNCAYCHKIWSKRYITRSAENLFEEVKLYYEAGFRRFNFIDDVFNLNLQNSRKFFELIIQHGLKVQIFFPSGFRGDRLTKEYIDLMVEAGTVNIALALETASPRLQKLIGKNLDLEKFREITEYIIKKHPQVILELFTMHGLPTETEKEAFETLEFVKSLKWVHFPYINILKIYPNTDMARLAVESGISMEAIERSADLAFHELPETLPFDKSFTRAYQAAFLQDYVLNPERLQKILPLEKSVLTEDELVQKYDSYLPAEIHNVNDILRSAGLKNEDLEPTEFLKEKEVTLPPDFNERIARIFPAQEKDEDALRVLLLDLNQYFSGQRNMLYDVVEAPLGLISLLTYTNHIHGSKVRGKIAKSRIDFDSFADLQALIDEFQPDVIGLSCLTFYRNFFHQTASLIRQWGFAGPIIAGGPYATGETERLLQDEHIDLVVRGEGELTFSELIGELLTHDGQLPNAEKLMEIPGIAFIKDKAFYSREMARQIICLDQAALPQKQVNNLPVQSKPDSLAYIIYTSGSTGKPKGVMVEHQSVVNLVQWFDDQYDIQKNSNVLQFTNITFDVSVEEIFGTLLHGGTVHIPEQAVILDRALFREYLQEHRINLAQFVPVTLREFLLDGEIISSLRKVICGGEKVEPQLIEKTLALGYDLYNHYGPTETTVDALTVRCNESQRSIGKPVQNMRVYILSSSEQLQPVGVYGEICIAGAGLARGYLGMQASNKFVPDPFVPGERMYRTGDLGRWLPDGNVEFSGRLDQQIKIRGFRVELGEIESHLLAHTAVKETVVLVQTDGNGNKYLSAYLVTISQVGVEELQRFLAKEMPEYMIPTAFTFLDHLPLNASGKVDRKRLQELEDELGQQDGNYEAPQNELESILAEVWQRVLSLQRIGVTDNFFALGGDSIKSIQIAAALQKYSLQLKGMDILQYPTIRQLVPRLKTAVRTAEQGMITGKVELTPIQQWFFAQDYTKMHHYNQSVLLQAQTRFELELVREVLQTILSHHDALRMYYRLDEAKPQQINGDLEHSFHFNQIRLQKEVTYNEIMTELIRQEESKINISTGPLVRAALFQTPKEDYLLWTIHHLVVDGVSWRILLDDFSAGYQASLQGEPIKFPAKNGLLSGSSYRTLLDYASSSRLKKELTYWQEIETLKVSPLPKDRKVQRQNKPEVVRFELSCEETERLIKHVNHAYNTEIIDILLTALVITIHQWSQNELIAVALEGHGREEITQEIDITRTVGWFTTIYPVVFNIHSQQNVADQLKYVKENLRHIPMKGIGYGILKYLAPHEVGAEILHLEPEISFNYLGQFSESKTSGEGTLTISKQPYLSKGDPRTEYALNIGGLITEGQLILSFIYNTSEYERTTVTKLTELYRKNLLNIINHCQNITETEITPSDLTYKDLTLEEFETVLQAIEL